MLIVVNACVKFKEFKNAFIWLNELAFLIVRCKPHLLQYFKISPDDGLLSIFDNIDWIIYCKVRLYSEGIVPKLKCPLLNIFSI